MKNTLLATLLLIPVYAQAQAPQEAINACKGVQINQQCQFNSNRGQVNGSCIKPPRKSQLVCAPANRNRQASSSQLNQQSGQARRSPRQHTINQSSGQPNLITADTQPVSNSHLQISIVNGQRLLQANGISEHLTGRFPNQGNPNGIAEQNYTFRVPANPQLANKVTPLGLHNFGLGINGVPFDPGAAEWYLGNRNGGWQYEALSGAIALGLDEGHAHVQPSGAYHYHGVPNLMLEQIGIASNQESVPSEHPQLVGWAADGFPIYALYGYQDADNKQSSLVALNSSYQLKAGHRPSGNSNPGGHYDGTFVADYEYQAGSGDLDQCNGRVTVTPEFPEGTYAYFLTTTFPTIPRCFRGTPSTDFTDRRGG